MARRSGGQRTSIEGLHTTVIYICVPAHNEEQTVGVVLWKVRQVMAELARDYQLLVADDGSTDRTPSVLEPYARVLPLTVFRNEQKRGYAAALEMLLREAVRRSEYPRRDTVVVLQADFTEDPQHVATLIRRIESGADIVVSNSVYGERPPPRGVRWGRVLLNRLLRRYTWPEGAHDPLTGLNAYRVACVKRALEERTGKRLLQFEGAVANAELLRESAPHARRVDAVELTVRRERLQREGRFQFRPLFHGVLAFIRGKPGAARPVEQLAADQVFGGRSQYRTLSAESLRESSVTNGAPRRGPQRGRGRTDRDTGRGGRGKADEQGRARARGGAEGGGRTRSAGEEKRTRREPGPRRPPASHAPAPEPASVSDEQAVPAAEFAAPVAESPAGAESQRKRRPRKRGRRSGTGAAASPAPEGTEQGTSLSAEVVAPEPVRNGGDAPFVAEGSESVMESGAPRKRRRGSRGGRRRSRSSGGAPEPNGNETSSGPEAPPDAAAAG
jgi:hypothetical protein